MSEPKGPTVELPEDLALELDRVDEPARAQAPEERAPASPTGEAPSDEAGGADAARARIAELEAELADVRDRHLRLAAEFENYKRRAVRERQELMEYGVEKLVKELLSTVDNLDRALGHAREGEEAVDSKALLDGVELTRRSLLQTLERFGMESVAAEGRPFDPQVHEAVRQVPTADVEPGVVVGVYQPGYRLRDRLLRPALVGVSCRPAGEAGES
jgi:molecular chaperone GrpE